jgi:hypothetical protein
MTTASDWWFRSWWHQAARHGESATEAYASMMEALLSAPESVRLELAALLNPWREIETATDEDKDGYVLGFVAGTKLPMVAVWRDADNRWFALNDAFSEDWNPTHYKPLPAPPLEEKK